VGVRGELDPLLVIELLVVGLTAVDTEQSVGIIAVICTQHSAIVHLRNALHFSGIVLRVSNPFLETIRVAKKIAWSDKTYRQNVQFIQGVINTRVLGEEGYFISYNILCFVCYIEGRT
jgi:hypothetical protein